MTIFVANKEEENENIFMSVIRSLFTRWKKSKVKHK